MPPCVSARPKLSSPSSKPTCRQQVWPEAREPDQNRVAAAVDLAPPDRGAAGPAVGAEANGDQGATQPCLPPGPGLKDRPRARSISCRPKGRRVTRKRTSPDPSRSRPVTATALRPKSSKGSAKETRASRASSLRPTPPRPPGHPIPLAPGSDASDG